MAEVCVGLSFVPPLPGLRLDRPTDPQSDGDRDFVVCGRVLPGHRVEIRDPDGMVLGDGQVGRLFVRGPSVMPGYFPPTEDSTDVLRDGWLDTGDLGYWSDDEIVITGRAKDLIIVNGRNIWPQDIEWCVEALPRLRRGDACAFSVETVRARWSWSSCSAAAGDAARALEALERRASPGRDKETFGVDGRDRADLAPRSACRSPRRESSAVSRAKGRFLAGGYAAAA